MFFKLNGSVLLVVCLWIEKRFWEFQKENKYNFSILPLKPKSVVIFHVNNATKTIRDFDIWRNVKRVPNKPVNCFNISPSLLHSYHHRRAVLLHLFLKILEKKELKKPGQKAVTNFDVCLFWSKNPINPSSLCLFSRVFLVQRSHLDTTTAIFLYPFSYVTKVLQVNWLYLSSFI